MAGRNNTIHLRVIGRGRSPGAFRRPNLGNNCVLFDLDSQVSADFEQAFMLR